MSAAPTLAPGTLIDDAWRVDVALGGGGMGSVYACTHLRNGLRVAIKILHAHAAKDPALRARFLAEGKALNRVNHPGVVRALGDGAIGGSPYLVMELAVGRSLREVAASLGGVVKPDAMRAVIEGLLDALAAVHAAGIIHRDVKPDNIIVTNDGRIKLVDFGIARVETSSSDTSTGTVLGTVAFMAPEQVMGKAGMVDSRADLFSVGAVLFRLLTGKNVHQNMSGMELLIAMGTRQAPSIRTMDPSLPRSITTIVDRALAFERERRFSTASEMREAWSAAFSLEALKAPVGRKVPPWSIAALGLVIGLLSIGVALLLTTPDTKTERSKNAAADDDDEPSERSRSKSSAAAKTVPAQPKRSKGDGVCRKDLADFRASLARDGADLRASMVLLTEDVSTMLAIDGASNKTSISCVMTMSCMRQSLHEDGSDMRTFDPKIIVWDRFRPSCEAAEAKYEAEFGRKGKVDRVSFDIAFRRPLWMFNVDGGKSKLFCFTPEGTPDECLPR